MPLTQEQIKALKKQLAEQISHLPPEQQEQAQAQIDQMSPESLEALLAQSQQAPQREKGEQKQTSPYRMIINKEIPAVIADENEKALAVLEIKPISKGHTIIIPKSPAKTSKDIPAEALSLAKKLAKRSITNLKAQSAEIATETKFNETIINIIPVYTTPLSLNSPRSSATQEDLEKLAQKLKPEKKQKPTKIKPSTQQGEILKLPRRIP